MAHKDWFIHINGETLGPISENLVGQMLTHRCCGFADFAWCHGMTHWVRISELPNFSRLMPAYPKISVPKELSEGGGDDLARHSPARTKDGNANPMAPNLPRSIENSNAGGIAPRNIRVPIGAKVTFGASETFRVLNISESGLLLEVFHEILLIGKEVQFTLSAPMLGKPLQMTGVLVREASAEGQNSVGIEFTRVNPSHLRLIKSYVQSREEKKNAA